MDSLILMSALTSARKLIEQKKYNEAKDCINVAIGMIWGEFKF